MLWTIYNSQWKSKGLFL